MQDAIDMIQAAKRNALLAIHKVNDSFPEGIPRASMTCDLQDIVTSLTSVENTAVRVKSKIDLDAEQRT